MGTVTSRDGTTIGFRASGSGPPLLFVHGTTADHMSWNGVTPYLAQDFTVYAMDRRGRGLSGDAADYNVTREPEDVVAVVESLAEPVFLFGHSSGGLFALEACLLTDRVSRLILYEPALPTGETSVPAAVAARIRALVDAGDLEGAMAFMLREGAQLPEPELEAYRQSPLWQQRIPLAATVPRELELECAYRFDPARFADLALPTLLLLGGDSPAQDRTRVELLASTLPHAEVVTLPGQRHMAHHATPDMLAGAVRDFLLP